MIREQQNGSKVHTFADSKGLVIFKHSKVKAEAFEFVSWVFSDDELSLLWLEKTGLPPARGDLTENEIFRKFYQANPMVAEYAAYVDVAVPPAFIEGTIDVQKFMGIEMLEPVQYGTKDPKTALADSVRRTDKLLNLLQ
jgi:multiple sugar transport system substrate-binding protein